MALLGESINTSNNWNSSKGDNRIHFDKSLNDFSTSINPMNTDINQNQLFPWN